MDRDDDPALADSQGRGRFDPNNELRYYIVGSNPSYGYNYRYLNTQIMGLDPNGTNPTPFYFVGNSLSVIERPASTICFAEATMKDKTVPTNHGGPPMVVKSTIGYARIEPPSRWVGTWPDARSYGQLWPRFNKDLVNVGWLDGHVKPRAMKSIKGAGSVAFDWDRLYNGNGD
jgi:prepilin-type processing-associated H-X9-DG protein